MKQVFRKIPVYTGDVSGVCSALYELGGMVVMHDPSGCNSTYNTHDEIRWYDHDSLIFLSGLNEMDAILGSDEKLIQDTIEAAKVYAPAFIAIANSPIPYITGMDFDAICRLIEQETGIPAFYISTNGMHDYIRGAGLAFLHLAERFVKPADAENTDKTDKTDKSKSPAAGSDLSEPSDHKRKLRCNILGMTPLDFAAETTYSSLQKKIQAAGMVINSCWAMEDSLSRQAQTGIDRTVGEQAPDEPGRTDNNPVANSRETDRNDLFRTIRNSASADVNLVISSVGLPVAQYLYAQYKIPFVAGIPAAGVEEEYFAAVRQAIRTGKNQFPFRDRTGLSGLSTEKPDKKSEKTSEKTENPGSVSPVCLIGEPVIMTSLAASIQKRTGAETHVYGATETSSAFLGGSDAALCGEEELESALKEVAHKHLEEGMEDRNKGKIKPVRVVADPCYTDILPADCELVRLPHLAFSGRIFLKEIPDPMQVVL